MVYDPTGSTGLPSAGWTPLTGCLTWQGAQRVADWLVRGARPGGVDERRREFWYGAAAKLLAPILLAAACSGGSMATGRRLGRRAGRRTRHRRARAEQRATKLLERVRGDRALGRHGPAASVYATAETVLVAYADPGVLASAHDVPSYARSDSSTAAGTPPTSARRRTSSAASSRCSRRSSRRSSRTPTSAPTETGKPLDPPLLLVLDECANIAPLRDLATLASTGAGQGIQLVSVFQDMAQINAVYGRDRAPTIVSNHRAKVILSGIADPQTLDYVARLLGDEEVPHDVVDVRRRGPTLDDASRSPTATSRRRTSCARCGPVTACSSTATSRRRESRCGPGSRTASSVTLRDNLLAVWRPRYRERHPRRPDHSAAQAPREAPRGTRP